MICSAPVRPCPPYSFGQVIPANPASYSLAWKAFCPAMTAACPLVSASASSSDPRRGALAASHARALARKSSLIGAPLVGRPGRSAPGRCPSRPTQQPVHVPRPHSQPDKKLKSVILLMLAPSEARGQIHVNQSARISLHRDSDGPSRPAALGREDRNGCR